MMVGELNAIRAEREVRLKSANWFSWTFFASNSCLSQKSLWCFRGSWQFWAPLDSTNALSLRAKSSRFWPQFAQRIDRRTFWSVADVAGKSRPGKGRLHEPKRGCLNFQSETVDWFSESAPMVIVFCVQV